MDSKLTAEEMENSRKELDKLREENAGKQKCGLPFIIASVVIWILISVVCGLNLNVNARNMLVFCCSCPLMPIAMLAGKILKVDIFDKENPLGKLGFIFTMNQMIYLLIVMWAFNAAPYKMVMVYAMVFGAHLLPYFWLYKTKTYLVSAILLPISALILDSYLSTQMMAVCFAAYEALFSAGLYFISKKRFG